MIQVWNTKCDENRIIVYAEDEMERVVHYRCIEKKEKINEYKKIIEKYSTQPICFTEATNPAFVPVFKKLGCEKLNEFADRNAILLAEDFLLEEETEHLQIWKEKIIQGREVVFEYVKYYSFVMKQLATKKAKIKYDENDFRHIYVCVDGICWKVHATAILIYDAERKRTQNFKLPEPEKIKKLSFNELKSAMNKNKILPGEKEKELWITG